jgi:hypothetical protein
MKIVTRRIHLSLLSLLLVSGCASSGEPDEEAGPVDTEAGLADISAYRAQRGDRALLRDEPAARAFEAAATASAQGRPFRPIAIYQLAPVGDAVATARARTAALGMSGAAVVPGSPDRAAADFPTPLAPNVYARQGGMKLRMNAYSGAELLADEARFHGSDGVATLPLAEADYIDRARQYMEKQGGLRERGLDPSGLYTYKLRRYTNGEGRPGEEPITTVYQVGVAFNQAIDDLPIVGPGSKFVVHMAPNGDVVAHEQNLRAVARKLGEVGAADLVSPESARREVERRFTERGVDLSGYVAARSELGYLRLGRDSVQSVLAPAYSFTYDPLPGVMGKRLVETVPATRNPRHLQLIAADDKAEQSRKALISGSAQPDRDRITFPSCESDGEISTFRTRSTISPRLVPHADDDSPLGDQ